MPEEHPNVALMKRLDSSDLAGCADLFAQQFVLHYFNPRLPELQGDYVGPSGLGTLFERRDLDADRQRHGLPCHGSARAVTLFIPGLKMRV